MADASLDLAGDGTIRAPAPQRKAKIWRINILGPAGSTCQLFVGSIAAPQFRDGSRSGSGDVAEYPNGLQWPAGMQLFFVWDKPGPASVHIEYDNGA